MGVSKSWTRCHDIFPHYTGSTYKHPYGHVIYRNTHMVHNMREPSLSETLVHPAMAGRVLGCLPQQLRAWQRQPDGPRGALVRESESSNSYGVGLLGMKAQSMNPTVHSLSLKRVRSLQAERPCWASGQAGLLTDRSSRSSLSQKFSHRLF